MLPDTCQLITVLLLLCVVNSSYLEVQERAVAYSSVLNWLVGIINAAQQHTSDFYLLMAQLALVFGEKLNPVNPKAQKKVSDR